MSARNAAEAIELGESTLKDTLEDDPEYATMTHNLANMYENVFNLDGTVERENSAIKAAEEAMLRTLEDHPRLPVHLTMLGHNLWWRYERTGRMEDLEHAIHYLEQAIRCLENSADPQNALTRVLPPKLNSLRTILFSRYQSTGDAQDSRGDLGRAILATEDAIELMSREEGDLSMQKNNLSVLLINRFDISGDEKDLNRAIQLGEETLQQTNASHNNNLGTALERHYLQTGNLEDLTAAIKHAQLSVNNTPSDYRDLSGRLNNLGSLMLREPSSRWEDALQHFERS